VFYIHFINAGAAVATFAALIGLFCLIMIIGFYDSLIMRWCIEKSWSAKKVSAVALVFPQLFMFYVLFSAGSLARCWAFCWSWWLVSQATQLPDWPDRHCRSVLKRRTASMSAYAGWWCAAVLIM